MSARWGSGWLPPHLAHGGTEYALSGFVPGRPRPKGSVDTEQVVDGSGRRTGRVRVKQGSPESSAWQQTMAVAFRECRMLPAPMVGPIVVSAVFWFDPMRYGPKTRALPYPMGTQIGDLDKLLRNVFDALQQAKIIADDRNVVEVVNTRKAWIPLDVAACDRQEGVAVHVLAFTEHEPQLIERRAYVDAVVADMASGVTRFEEGIEGIGP